MDSYSLIKWLHILSSTLLFGTGLGTAFQMWITHKRGSVEAIARVSKNTVLADWLFTLPSGIVQPISGFLLIHIAGWNLDEPWLVLSYALYILALGCWILVVRLQIRIAAIAENAVKNTTSLSREYHRSMIQWFWLGWPAFASLMIIYWLMIAKPDLSIV